MTAAELKLVISGPDAGAHTDELQEVTTIELGHRGFVPAFLWPSSGT